MPKRPAPSANPPSRARPGLDFVAPRSDAIATVHVTCSYSRYRLGEIVIETSYRLSNSRTETDPRRRIYLDRQPAPVIRHLWDTLFEEVYLAQQCQARAVIIKLAPETMPIPWDDRVHTIATIVAHELGVVVAGTGVWRAKLAQQEGSSEKAE